VAEREGPPEHQGV